MDFKYLFINYSNECLFKFTTPSKLEMMRLKSFILVHAGLLISAGGYVQGQPDWENPEIFERNQTRPHTTLMPFETIEPVSYTHLTLPTSDLV